MFDFPIPSTMRLPFQFSILALVMALNASAQDCPLQLRDGMKVKLKVRNYTNALVYDPKFQKEKKEEKKDELIMAYNRGIESGETKPSGVTDLTYTAKGGKATDGNLAFSMTTTINGTEYSSYVVCDADTMYLMRNVGPIEVPDGKGGIYGYSIQAAQKLPLRLKVGDVLPSYSDIMVILPTTMDIKVKKQVFSHNSTSTTREFGFYTETGSGQQGFGNYTKTTTRAVYRSIDVDVRKTTSGSGHCVNYAYAQVTGEEDLMVNGQKHHAYIIDSEKWFKMTMTEDFESADERVAQEQKAQSEKIKVKMGKFMVKKGFTNPQGYLVSYIREYFVPALGVVKMVAYDTWGGIASETVLEGLE